MKTRIFLIEAFALMALLSGLYSCSERLEEEACVSICFKNKAVSVKSAAFDEDGVYDINLWIFAPDGTLEEHIYKEWKSAKTAGAEISRNLLFRREYSFYAIANAGASLGQMSLEELNSYRLYIPYPDGGARGMPMAGCVKNAYFTKTANTLALPLERMMSRVDVSLDRSSLNDDVEFHIMGLRVGNCPKCATVFGRSAVTSEADLFASGFYSSGTEVRSVYLFENLQGICNPKLSSYIEVEIDYSSDKYISTGRKGLVYRFYIRENNTYDIERNCIYAVTICPNEDGLLCEDSWRVDKSGLVPADESSPYLEISPGGSTVEGIYYDNFYTANAGDSLHFSLDFSPPRMEVKLREDIVEDEREEGRAIYEMDSDGKGFSVKGLGKTCVTMMEILAGEPLNDSETLVISLK